jgi:hypothetical protein
LASAGYPEDNGAAFGLRKRKKIGGEQMLLKQLSVFLENKSGSLADVSGVLSEAGIKQLSAIVTDTAEFGVLRIIVDDPERSQEILRAQGFSCRTSDVCVFQVDDKSGVAAVLKQLSMEGLNVEYMYAFSGSAPGKTWMAFRCNHTEKALETIERLLELQDAKKKDATVC